MGMNDKAGFGYRVAPLCFTIEDQDDPRIGIAVVEAVRFPNAFQKFGGFIRSVHPRMA